MNDTMTTALHNSAMLATLTISQWTARKHDSSVSAEVEKAHQAKDAGRYNKMLIDKAALEPISKIANAARQYHYKMTLPWGDNGDRLLPASLFMDYTETLNGYRTEFRQRVREFVATYPDLCQAARSRLGTMYNAEDYPASFEISERFEIATEFTPVATANDFRVQLNEEYVTSIKRDIEQRMETRQRDAMKHCYDRVKEVVSRIHERLADKDNTFRDTLITNAEELLALLPALNITGDQELIDIGNEVKELLVHPDRLRQDDTLRSETADKAKAILAKFGM